MNISPISSLGWLATHFVRLWREPYPGGPRKSDGECIAQKPVRDLREPGRRLPLEPLNSTQRNARPLASRQLLRPAITENFYWAY